MEVKDNYPLDKYENENKQTTIKMCEIRKDDKIKY